jgi:hypothetical protein
MTTGIADEGRVLQPTTLLPVPREPTWLAVDEPLALLDADLGNDGCLSELGRLAAAVEIESCLTMQAQAAANRRREATAPSELLVVGGLPRTGTTVLHDLATKLFGATAPSPCEVANPLLAFEPEGDRAATGEAVAARLDLLRAVAPKVLDMHPMAADGLDECTPILQSSLRSVQLLMMFHAPRYLEWFLEEHLRDTYRYWLRQISLIATGRSGPRPFVTKSPLHFLDYGALLDAAPTARIVQVRRPLVPWFESFLNMAFAARTIFSDAVDPGVFGREWATTFPRLLDRATEHLPGERAVLTLDYERLCRDPVATVLELRRGLGWDPAGTGRIKDVVLPVFRRQRRLHGPYARLGLRHFGLSPTEVGHAFRRHVNGPFLAP